MERAAAAGLRTIAVTDHDTTGGLDEARARAATAGITLIDGIEITAVDAGRDVHVLGYFIDTAHGPLLDFLTRQRQDRVRRVREIAQRLEALGAPIDPEPLVARAADAGRSVGRPHVAAALVEAGHVTGIDEAFARYLAHDGPAFVPRRGTCPEEVCTLIHAAGGVASLAHPGLTRIDPRLPDLAGAGLDALEVRHSEHDTEMEARYRATAAALGLAVTAGSDFHGDHGVRATAMGRVTMSELELAGLMDRRP